MVIPQPSLSEKVINRAASPTHSFESFGIISTDSFSFHSLGVGSLAKSPATLNPTKEPTNPDTDCHVGNVIKSVIGVEERVSEIGRASCRERCVRTCRYGGAP